MRNQFYPAVVILFVLAFIAGCSSTPEAVEEAPTQATPPEQAAVQEEPVRQEPAQQSTPEPEPEVALETIFYFDFDDTTLRFGDRSAIEAHAEQIKSGSQVIRIEGHADERGTEAYNKQLGQRRANAVRDLLISMGVNSGQIETVSYGEQNPKALGSSEDAWQKNRRVEIRNI